MLAAPLRDLPHAEGAVLSRDQGISLWFFVSGALLVLIFGFLLLKNEAIIVIAESLNTSQQPSTFRSFVPLALF